VVVIAEGEREAPPYPIIRFIGCQREGAYMQAYIVVDSYAGRRMLPCRIVGETPKKYRVEVDEPTLLPPRNMVLAPGESQLVPKSAVRQIG